MKRPKQPHGSTWFYTAAPDLTPAEAAAVLARLEAIPAYQQPAPRRPETIEPYAARMARRNPLPSVGATGGSGPRWYGAPAVEWERMPDDDAAPEVVTPESEIFEGDPLRYRKAEEDGS